jgi:CMP/dCMP kinase
MTTITISRQFGSYGDEIARRVCDILDYHYFDKNLIANAAKASGLSEREIVDYSEENYKVRTFLDGLLRRAPTVAQVSVWKEDTKGIQVAENIKLSEDTALMLIQNAVLYAHRMGNIVIVGRGGQAVLKDKTSVLHVRIKASYEERVQRIREQMRQEKHLYDASIDLRRAAQDLILQKDAASEEYVKYFYGVDWDDPYLYHLCLNTGKLTVEQAAQTIAKSATELFKLPESVEMSRA